MYNANVSYLAPITALRDVVEVRALAHLTGGGFLDNIPRVLPAGLGATVSIGTWPTPEIFKIIRREAQLSSHEAHRTFNMGIGLVAVVPEAGTSLTVETLAAAGVPAWEIGEIVEGAEGVRLVE